jgi:hypothetical protein
MKLIDYVGTEGPCLVIERPTDLFPALDHIQNIMIELEESTGSTEAARCVEFISGLMEQAEANGFGSHDDVENVEHR